MCHRCKTTLPSNFHLAGPHVKEVCSDCGFYIKFASKRSIPDYIQTKKDIWEVTNDVELISKYKTEVGITGKETYLHRDVLYWNLYIRILKHFDGNGSKNTERDLQILQ